MTRESGYKSHLGKKQLEHLLTTKDKHEDIAEEEIDQGQEDDEQDEVVKFLCLLINKTQEMSDKALVVIVEDIQWMDLESMGTFRSLVTMQFKRVTFIFTSRTFSEVHQKNKDLYRKLWAENKENDRLLRFSIGKNV